MLDKIKVDIPMFPYDIHFLLGEWDQADVNKYMKRRCDLTLEAPDELTEGSHWVIGASSFIWVGKGPRNATWYAILMHEIHHAVQEASRFIGMGDGPEADEFRCYLMGYVSKRIFRKLWV